jgi:iron uptake system component EfeO
MLGRRMQRLLLVALLVPIVGCAADADAESAAKVTVTATDDRCDLDRVDLTSGPTTFVVTNRGSKVTEVYVYGQDGQAFTKVISEVENIGPGTSRDLTVTLGGGTYEVACKPGQQGDGIRTKITVAGDTSPTPSTDDGGYDREVELTTDGTQIKGDLGAAKLGETIEFKLTNNATSPVILELKDPSGKVAGETAEIQVGETGELVVSLASAGTWVIIVEATGRDDVTAPLSVV